MAARRLSCGPPTSISSAEPHPPARNAAAPVALRRQCMAVVAAHLEECLAGRSPAETRVALERAVHLLTRGG